MAIETIPADEIIVRVEPTRSVIIMTDTAPERAEGLRAGDHLVGIGGTAEIRHREEITFGDYKTAAIIQFDTEANLAKAMKPFEVQSERDWMGEGPRSGSRDIWANGDTSLIGATFKAVASAKGASVLYDGGLAAVAAPGKEPLPLVEILASKKDVKRAIDVLHERNLLETRTGKGDTPTSRVLAGLAPAIVQPQWEKRKDGSMRETGEVKSGTEALERLAETFGRGEHRRILIDADKAQAMMRAMNTDMPKAYQEVLAETASRAAARKTAQTVRKSEGVAR